MKISSSGKRKLLILWTLLCIGFTHVLTTSIYDETTVKFKRPPKYLILAPSLVRPNEDLQLSVSLYDIDAYLITVRSSLRMGKKEYAATERDFRPRDSGLIQMKIPEYLPSGDYSLRVEGRVSGLSTGLLFFNESRVEFDSKQVSIFIQTHRSFLRKGRQVKFRVLAVRKNLMHAEGRVNIYVYETGGAIVRRWLNKQLRFGMTSGSFSTGSPATYGMFKIVVDGFGHKYEYKFKVTNYHPERFDINVTIPTYIFEDDFGLAGTVMANLTGDGPARGNGTVALRIFPKDADTYKEIRKPIHQITGVASFIFTTDEMRAVVGEALADALLEVHANIFSWNLLQENSAKATAKVYRRGVRIKFLGDHLRTFKPLVKFHAYLAVEAHDGSRLAGSRRKILFRRTIKMRDGTTIYGEKEHYVVPDDSIVHYMFTPLPQYETVTLRATFDNENDQRMFTECYLVRHFSPSHTFVEISTSTPNPEVNQYMIFTVKISRTLADIKYMIISGGNIIIQDDLRMKSLQKTFSVAVADNMAPRSTIVVYGIRPIHGEIATDSMSFYVRPASNRLMTLTTNNGKDFSGDTMEITANTEPGSMVALTSDLFETYARGGSPFITKEKVYRDLESYDAHMTGTFKQTWWGSYEKYEDIHFPSPTYGIDSTTTLELAGLLVFTDSGLVRIPNQCNASLGLSICYDGSCFPTHKRCDGETDCAFASDEMGCENDRDQIKRPAAMDWMQLRERHIWPIDFAWKEQMTKPDGRADIQVAPPTRAAIFVVDGFAVSKENGLQFLNKPIRIDCIAPFYIRVEGPAFAYAGEQVGFRITLLNFWNQYLEALVILHKSSDYQFVHVEDGGLVSSYSPRTSFGTFQTLVYIEAGETKLIHFPVLPVVTGKVTVTFTAQTFIRQETVSFTLNIRHNGITNEYHTPYLIDLVSQGSQIIPDLWIPVPERFIHPEQREHLYVPGSASATVTIVGDVVGPSFFSSKMNAISVLGQQYDTGEPIAFTVALNIWWMEYLHAINQLDEVRQRNAIAVINKEIQSVCAYVSADGAGSMFRKGPDSVWLTAFYLKTLHKATQTIWELDMFIDVNLLNQMAMWLVKQQNVSTGSFSAITNIYDRKMMPEVTEVKGEKVELHISLNAYVLISLCSLDKLTGEAQHRVSDAKTRTAIYLSDHLYNITDPFTQAITTYALHLADHSSKSTAFERLKSMRIIPGGYWASKPIPEIRTRVFNTVPFLLERDLHENEANGVAATSYAMLTYLLNGEFEETDKMMKWLQTQRETYAGFFSTQDTIIALEALSAYSIRDTHRELYNMLIVLESTSTPSWKKEIRITRDNLADLQTFQIPKAYGAVKATAYGTGRALVQLITKVNVEYPWQLKPAAARSFDFWVDNLFFYGRNASFMEISLCMRWMRPDLGPTSGLTLLEMDVPSGYHVPKSEIRAISKRGPPTLKRNRYKYSLGFLKMWFEYVTTTKTCITIHAERWYPVANSTIQHKIKLYDYYEPGLYNFTMYNTYTLYNLHVCQVCGSFQCPYCPGYNTSTVTSSASFWSIVLPIILLFWQLFHHQWRLSDIKVG